MQMPTLTELLEAGVHFGHKKERSHPKAKNFTFLIREGIFIIDLEKTNEYLKDALEFLKKEISLGKTILFVGTKKQAKEITQKVAESAGMPYITHRWLGGLITNFETVRKSIKEMDILELKIKSPEFKNFTKKEQKETNDRLTKLNLVFGGIREMKNLPDVVFAVDALREKLAISEASKMNISVVAINDTDANPEAVAYPIPANDDASKALDLIMNKVSEALKEGQGLLKFKKAEEAVLDKNEPKSKEIEEKAEVKKTNNK